MPYAHDRNGQPIEPGDEIVVFLPTREFIDVAVGVGFELVFIGDQRRQCYTTIHSDLVEVIHRD